MRPGQAAPSPGLSEHKIEKVLYEYIKSKRDMGIWSKDIKREMKELPTMKQVPAKAVDKSLESLLAKNLIKLEKSAQHKRMKQYMASEFEPSEEVSGGVWYKNGSLDTSIIDDIKKSCLKCISRLQTATVDLISDGLLKDDKLSNHQDRIKKLSKEHIAAFLRSLVLGREIVQVESAGLGEFSKIPTSAICFKLAKKRTKVAAIASAPCGVCPRMQYCSPDGITNPISCEYYNKFLDF